MGIWTVRKRATTTRDPDFNEPLSGGNNYNVQKELSANDARLREQAAQLDSTAINGISDISKHFNKYQYTTWAILNLHADYFTNIFNFEFETKDSNTQHLYQKVLRLFRYSWMYGNCGIYKLAEKYIPVYEIKANTDANGELDTIELGLLNDIINTNDIIDISKKQVWLKIRGDDDNYARLYGDVNNMGAVIKWMPFIQQQTDLLSRIYTMSFILNKKIVYTVKNNNVKLDELELFINPKLPIIFKLNGYAGNEFSTEQINGLSDSIDAGVKYYEFFIKCYYELLGRKLNSDAKNERNVSSEIQATQDNYDVLQRAMKEQRRYFLNHLTKLTGIQWIEKGVELNDPTGTNDDNAPKSNTGDNKE